jgi:Mn2+/Fe2+ NRAMP family transporter
MVLSNVIGFFIIVATAATLHAHGTININAAAEAAESLRPLAGELAFLLFAIGIIGTGLLAIPALAGSAAYAIAEGFGWKNSLGLAPWRAQGFYIIIAAATLMGSFGALLPINPIRLLVWSAAFNGIVAVPLMAGMMVVVSSRKIMGKFAASALLTTCGWLATLLMGAVVAAFFFASVTG